MDSKRYYLFLLFFLVFKMIEANRFVNSQRALPALSLSIVNFAYQEGRTL